MALLTTNRLLLGGHRNLRRLGMQNPHVGSRSDSSSGCCTTCTDGTACRTMSVAEPPGACCSLRYGRDGLAPGAEKPVWRDAGSKMKVALTALSFFAAMSVNSHAAKSSFYNAVAAYGACQEHALHGEHYAINGDCPNWEAWKAGHGQGRQAYPTPRRRHRPNQ